MGIDQSNKITSLDIFLYLRQRLLDAREKRDMDIMSKLQTVFIILSDLAYLKKVGHLGAILEELENSARDSIMGVPWKSTIPSEEDIRSALQEETG